MGNRAKDFIELAAPDVDEGGRLGDAIAGSFDDVDLDSVGVVRDLRRRT